VVADRTVSDDNPVALALDALFELGDGRFRLDDLCDFAMRPAVRQRFGLSAGDVTRVAELLAEANVRWGLGPQDQARLGMEPLGAHTVLDGLHRVMVAAVGGRDLSDRVLDGIVPAPIATVDDLVPLGRFSHLVDRLSTHIDALSRPADICTWIARVEEALTDLIEAEDPMALRRVRRVLAELDDDGRLQGRSRGVVVNPGALVALARRRLVTASGRARFGTGRVTVSAMTAQRGIPAPVVCLLGADATAEAVIGVVPDDLIAAAPCVGDRDARSEQRAQFLDAIVSATQRFIICSTGFDLRTRAELPPSIMVAELVDLVRSITGTPLSSIDHPRQGWSETVFDPDAFGLGHPWGFDRGARDAALARRSRSSSRSSWMAPPLERPVTAGLETITPTDLLAALRDPCGIFARRRLGLATDDTAEAVLAVDIELESPGPLRFWQLEADAFATVLGSKPADTAALDAWVERAQGAGDLPPRGFAHAVASPILARARRLDDLLETHGVPREALGALAIDLRTTFADGTPVAVTGTIAGVSGSQLVVVIPSKAKPDQDLAVWLQLALCQLADPGSDWSAVLIRRNSGEGLDISRRRLRDIDAAQHALDIGLDLFDQARCRPVPFFPRTSRNLAFRLAADRDPDIKVPPLRKHWDMTTSPGSADRYRPSVSWFFDLELEDLRRHTDADEWADRIFSAMDSGVDIEKLGGGTARSGRKAQS
jgi:exodeoxyribonuclease V gamma subunit